MAQTVFCIQCGKEIPEDAMFCLHCGARQEVVPQIVQSPEPKETSTPPPPPPPLAIARPSPTPEQKRPKPWMIICIAAVGAIIIIGLLIVIPGIFPNGGSLPGIPATPTSIPVSTPTLQPGPTQTVPPGTEVQIQVNKNNANGEITFLFAGGPGQKVVRTIDVKVTREDVTVLSGTLKPVALEEVVLQGTRGGTDRVEVRVTYLSGNVYTIIDRQIGIRD